MQLISEMLNRAVKTYPEKKAIIFNDSSVKYNELNENVNKLANGLKKLGIGKGDRVMVQLVNGPEIIMAHYAIIKVGAIVVPLNVMYIAHEITYIGMDTGARAIIVGNSFLQLLEEIRPALPDLEIVIVAGYTPIEGTLQFKELIAGSTEEPDICQADDDDIVSIIYTSGTTGRPKGATQTHRSILSNVSSLCNFNNFSPKDRLLCALPLFNNFALNVVMMSAFYLGSTLIVVDRFEAVKVLEHLT